MRTSVKVKAREPNNSEWHQCAEVRAQKHGVMCCRMKEIGVGIIGFGSWGNPHPRGIDPPLVLPQSPSDQAAGRMQQD